MTNCHVVKDIRDRLSNEAKDYLLANKLLRHYGLVAEHPTIVQQRLELKQISFPSNDITADKGGNIFTDSVCSHEGDVRTCTAASAAYNDDDKSLNQWQLPCLDQTAVRSSSFCCLCCFVAAQ